MNSQVIDDNYYKVLFEIDADNSDMSKFTSIKEFSKFPHEDEYLINFNNFLSLDKIEFKDNNKYVHLYIKFSDISILKNKISKTTLDYQNTINEILRKNYNLDHFYLAEIFEILKYGDKLLM